MNKLRQDNQPPLAVEEWGWRYHHMGVPTDDPHPDEVYLPQLKMYVSGFRTSPFGIEWMRFDSDSPVTEIIQNLPHIAFEVDNLEQALAEDFHLLGSPSSPSPGVRVAMILHNGIPVELLEFEMADRPNPGGFHGKKFGV